MGISREEAAKLALDAANAKWGHPKGGDELLIMWTGESGLAWAFTYNTRSFAESQDAMRALPPGNGPIIVVKATGKLVSMPSAYSGERALEVFETDNWIRPQMLPPMVDEETLSRWAPVPDENDGDQEPLPQGASVESARVSGDSFEPCLFVDARGVWSEKTPGHPSGIAWSEVYKVSGHKLDGVTEVYTCVVLDFEYGEFMELYHHRPGFDQVVGAITQMLPGIAPGWFDRIEKLGVADRPIEVWRRP